ncbi:MAG: 2-succinyl-6-hydroxy-2,4-cyclohexadiene-1-carboxylate synthase, partial [Thermomicrobiaceae bacterium]|nr:2-succinyl-6-hydroxy-2,4-cyclohexadiene-1-carboxylate synthase [Thermomicrobiaceae bacterium]
TVAVDLLGHGASDAPRDPARYRMERCVADLLALLDALDLPRAAVLGYSMGGRVALHLALAAPERVGALVLESASPGIPDAAERAARRVSDAALADLIEREGIAAFVDHWERLPLWASQASLPREVRARLRAQRLAHRPDGLAGSLRGLGAGEMAPVHDRLGALGMPALLVAGALDEKYRALAEWMAIAMPRARVAVVPGAGHAVHLERPEAFLRAVGAFLEEVAVDAAGGGEQA